MNIELQTRYVNGAVTLRFTHYHNGRKAIQVLTLDGFPALTATVNVPDFPLAQDEVLIKNWSENQGILEALILAEVIESPTSYVPSGFCLAYLCKIKIDLANWPSVDWSRQ